MVIAFGSSNTTCLQMSIFGELSMNRFTVMLVTHLPHVRQFVEGALRDDPDFVLVRSAVSLMDAFSAAEEIEPKIAIVSSEFTHLAEFEMIRALFSVLDVRWLVVSDEKVRTLATSKPYDSRYGIFSVDVSDSGASLPRALRSMVNVAGDAKGPMLSSRHGSPNWGGASSSDDVVLIGSSTGGVDALTTVLSHFSETCPPTFIVQHTGSAFGSSLVRLLNTRSPAKIVTAEDGIEVTSGMVCVGAGMQSHLNVVSGPVLSCRLKSGAPVSGHIPSVDELFFSARPFAKRVIACVLTGMGRDGAQGLLELKKAGARTLVQDETSSVVYGMPKVAWELGGADKKVSITKMADAIFSLCRFNRQRSEATSP